MAPSGKGPEVGLEVEVCILRGGGAGQGQGVPTDRGRNQRQLEEGEMSAEVPGPGAESVSAEPVLHRERESSRDLPAGGFWYGVTRTTGQSMRI